MIGDAFDISTKGEEVDRKGDNQAFSFFPAQSITETDGWSVKQCSDPTFRGVLVFLNPLLYPQKPHRVIVWIASTIVACLFHGRKTNWTSIFHKVITKQVVGKQKIPTFVSCNLLYLFKCQNLLTLEELESYESHKEAVERGNP
jgi:hypothetical protein